MSWNRGTFVKRALPNFFSWTSIPQDDPSENESRFIVQLKRKEETCRKGQFILTGLFALVHLHTGVLNTLNQSSSHLKTTLDSDIDVTAIIVTSSRSMGSVLGVLLSLSLGLKLTLPVLLYTVLVFTTCLSMPSSRDDVISLCASHVFQSIGLGLIQTSTYSLIYKMWEKGTTRATALQTISTFSIVSSTLTTLQLNLDATRNLSLSSLSWKLSNSTETFPQNSVNGFLPTLAVILALFVVLVSVAILSTQQIFPLESLLSSLDKPKDSIKDSIKESIKVKKRTFLAFILPAICLSLLKLNHIVCSIFPPNHINNLHQPIFGHITLFAYICSTLLCACAAIPLTGLLTLRSMIYTLGLCQISASVSFLLGRNVPVVMTTASVAMAAGTSYFMTPALLWASAYHNHVNIIIATLIASKDGLAEILYILLRPLVLPEITGFDSWIFLSSITSLLFMSTAYVGSIIMERITNKRTADFLT